MTSDTLRTARKELEGVDCALQILEGKNQDRQKENYVKKLGAENVVALGNGRNDSRMLKTAWLGIAVTEGEGCATEAVLAADILVRSAMDGPGLLFNPVRIKASLRN